MRRVGQDAAKTTADMTLQLMTMMHCLIRTMPTCLWMPSLGSKRGSSPMRDGHDQAQPLDLGQGQHARHDPPPLALTITAIIAVAGVGCSTVMTTATMTTV